MKKPTGPSPTLPHNMIARQDPRPYFISPNLAFLSRLLEGVLEKEKSPKAEVIARDSQTHSHNQSIQDVKKQELFSNETRLAMYLQSASYANYHLS